MLPKDFQGNLTKELHVLHHVVSPANIRMSGNKTTLYVSKAVYRTGALSTR